MPSPLGPTAGHPPTTHESAAAAWPTLLFASAPVACAGAATAVNAISVRAAYQLALHGRGLLLDARSDRERDTEGVVHPSLGPVLADELASFVGAPGVTALMVLAADTDATCRLAVALRRVLLRPVFVVHGGFAAWEQWGLPRLPPERAAVAA